MGSDAGGYAVLFNKFDGLCEKVRAFIFDPFVSDTALDISGGGPVIDGPFYISGQVIYLGVGLGNPLDFSAPFIPASIEDPDAPRQDGIYSVFFVHFEGLENLFIRAVGLE
jgi:hypothetical protein